MNQILKHKSQISPIILNYYENKLEERKTLTIKLNN